MTPLRSFVMTFAAALALLVAGHSAATELLADPPAHRAVA